jgi:DNA mismatch endonuclease, patch repair protein
VREYRVSVPEESWATTPAVRRSMQANRSRDTAPEIALRRRLYAAGLRYRVNTRALPGLRRNVDVVFRSAQVAVEVYGCFWHGCPKHYRRPTANDAYWSQKVARNVERDRAAELALDDAGWEVIVVWEHDNIERAAACVIDAVRRRRATRSR